MQSLLVAPCKFSSALEGVHACEMTTKWQLTLTVPTERLLPLHMATGHYCLQALTGACYHCPVLSIGIFWSWLCQRSALKGIRQYLRVTDI